MSEIPPVLARLPDIADNRTATQEICDQESRRPARDSEHFDAENVFNILMRRVAYFQNSLDASHEVGIQLANFGIASEIRIRAITYYNPKLIEFIGVRDGRQVSLVQHISQLNFLLVALPAEKPEEPYRIGFQLSDDPE